VAQEQSTCLASMRLSSNSSNTHTQKKTEEEEEEEEKLIFWQLSCISIFLNVIF
jgi:hypothetical protein